VEKQEQKQEEAESEKPSGAEKIRRTKKAWLTVTMGRLKGSIQDGCILTYALRKRKERAKKRKSDLYR